MVAVLESQDPEGNLAIGHKGLTLEVCFALDVLSLCTPYNLVMLTETIRARGRSSGKTVNHGENAGEDADKK